LHNFDSSKFLRNIEVLKVRTFNTLNIRSSKLRMSKPSKQIIIISIAVILLFASNEILLIFI